MKSCFLLAFLAIAFNTYSQQITVRPAQLVFKGVTLIPMDKERVLENQDLVVENGIITAIGRTGRVKYRPDAVVIDGRGKYLLPGLAEMHAHIPPVDDLEPMKENLLLFATHGITTIRGMLGHPKHLQLREMIATNQVTGPRFITSGPSLNGNSVKTPADADGMVRRQKQVGYDFLKLHPGLTREKFDSVAAAARRSNISFSGHVSFDVGIWHAIKSGYSTIDHLDGFIEGLVPGMENISEQQAGLFGIFVAQQADTSRIDTLMTALKNAGIWVVPTQALTERWFSSERSVEELLEAPEMKYIAANQRNAWAKAKRDFMQNPNWPADGTETYNRLRRRLILACQQHGVGLLLGSDAPQIFNVPGPSTHHELEYLVNSGLSNYEALRTGTANIGNYLGDEKLGVIRKGAYADLILLDANPLEDIRNTRKINGVLLNGNWLTEEAIHSALKTLEKP